MTGPVRRVRGALHSILATISHVLTLPIRVIQQLLGPGHRKPRP
jgi:hypothetical protein